MLLNIEVGLVLYIYFIGLDWTSFFRPSFFSFIGPCSSPYGGHWISPPAQDKTRKNPCKHFTFAALGGSTPGSAVFVLFQRKCSHFSALGYSLFVSPFIGDVRAKSIAILDEGSWVPIIFFLQAILFPKIPSSPQNCSQLKEGRDADLCLSATAGWHLLLRRKVVTPGHPDKVHCVLHLVLPMSYRGITFPAAQRKMFHP